MKIKKILSTVMAISISVSAVSSVSAYSFE